MYVIALCMILSCRFEPEPLFGTFVCEIEPGDTTAIIIQKDSIVDDFGSDNNVKIYSVFSHENNEKYVSGFEYSTYQKDEEGRLYIKIKNGQNIYVINKSSISYDNSITFKKTISYLDENEVINTYHIKLKKQKEERERMQQIEQQPIEISFIKGCGFSPFNTRFWGNERKTYGYMFKAVLKNRSSRTFIKANFENKNHSDNWWWNAKRHPHIEIMLNTPIRLSNINYGTSYGNWKKMDANKIPQINFEKPWKPGEEMNIDIYLQPDVTRGTMGEGYGDFLSPSHFNYEPTHCILRIPIYLEDAKGYKKQTYIDINILDDYIKVNPN